jgi:hypothetical protein
MKRSFTNEDLEGFLKTNSDRLQMRPSPRVWKAIADDLGRKRRRVTIFTGLFLLAVSSVTAYLSFNSQESIAGNQPTNAANNTLQVDNIKPLNNTNSVSAIRSEGLPAESSNRQEIASSANRFDQPAKNNRVEAFSVNSERNSSSLFVAYKNPAALLANNSSAVITNTSDPVTTTPVQSNIVSETFVATIVDSDPEQKTAEPEITSMTALPAVLPESIESVTNLFKLTQRKSKLSYEIFFTPTVSYRKLSENKEYMQPTEPGSQDPNVQALYNINDAVTHKPNIGLELGFTAKYPVANNLKLKAGFQFNVSRYDIKAFTHYTEAATMAFRDGNTTMSASNKRNVGGTETDWLQNIYYQVSAPVGAEVKFGRSKKTQFGFASTIQPTYMIGDRAYLISTDYKNYVEVPWLVRRWNINTAVETFVTHTTGKVNWQVGPQVRYQLLSSFISNYPVKENLFDFGLKIGVTLNKGTGSAGSKE